MADPKKSRERGLEDAVSRAVRDSLIPLQRTLEELQQAYADLVSACSSTRPTNTLPAMLRLQATAASLTASLKVVSSFVTGAMQQRDRDLSEEDSSESVEAVGVEVAPPPPIAPPQRQIPAPRAQASPLAEEPVDIPMDAEVEAPGSAAAPPAAEAIHAHGQIAEPQVTSAQELASEPIVEEQVDEPAPFDIANLPASEQELHKRANRVAKVSMQDIKMLKPEEVRKGRENNDICVRLRGEIDKARREYDRRFQKILDHPVDYFHHWLVEILGNGDPETLGEYPYPSPVLRR
ncbi:MAG TPA: hypothetical protein VKB26_07850 [Candidatus Acidoferrales bacterium]|nr:hypothetical protein [Candidatus Acidoferrales bacterium]